MRNQHLHIEKEDGRESMVEPQKWEHLLKKILDLENDRRFILSCLSKDTIAVSLKLSNTVGIPKCFSIIKKAEKWLLNECVRTMNNTIELCSLQKDTCISKCTRALDKQAMKDWQDMIERIRKEDITH